MQEDNSKYSLRTSQESVRLDRVKDMKLNSFEKLSFEKRGLPGHRAYTGPPREVFPEFSHPNTQKSL